MNYSIEIIGMHCAGCVNLIKMTLEELGFKNVDVSSDSKTATFTALASSQSTKELLDQAFTEDLSGYEYTNLIITD